MSALEASARSAPRRSPLCPRSGEEGPHPGALTSCLTAHGHQCATVPFRSMAATSKAPARTPKRVLLAAPRGYCAGVDRAVQAVEQALDLHGAPVYVRKEIVHNKHVVKELAKRGAIFVEEETEVPEGEVVVV